MASPKSTGESLSEAVSRTVTEKFHMSKLNCIFFKIKILMVSILSQNYSWNPCNKEHEV